MHGHQVFQTYLAFKQHFSNEKFDFFKYDGKVKVKEETYQQRNDYWFFETLARKLTDTEVKEYMLASFVSAENPEKVWVGDVKRDGRDRWLVFQKLHAGLSYTVQQDCIYMVEFMEKKSCTFNQLFEEKHGHPPALKLYLKKDICLETLIILDMVLGFIVHWDRSMKDPLWEQISFKIKKYKPFLSINTTHYKKLVKSVFV